MKPNTKQYRIVTALHKSEPKSAGEIADTTGVKRTTVSSSLSKLRHKGFVDRHGDGGHTDPYRYELTDKGTDEMTERESNGGLNQLFDDPNVPGTDDEDTDQSEPTENEADVPFTAGVDEAADILLALGAADEPDFDTRHRVAVSVVSSLLGDD
jgi:DNA-binding MarR family transcriptional regulator